MQADRRSSACQGHVSAGSTLVQVCIWFCIIYTLMFSPTTMRQLALTQAVTVLRFRHPCEGCLSLCRPCKDTQSHRAAIVELFLPKALFLKNCCQIQRLITSLTSSTSSSPTPSASTSSTSHTPPTSSTSTPQLQLHHIQHPHHRHQVHLHDAHIIYIIKRIYNCSTSTTLLPNSYNVNYTGFFRQKFLLRSCDTEVVLQELSHRSCYTGVDFQVIQLQLNTYKTPISQALLNFYL